VGWHGSGDKRYAGKPQPRPNKQRRPGGGQAGSAYHFALTDGSIVIVWYNSWWGTNGVTSTEISIDKHCECGVEEV